MISGPQNAALQWERSGMETDHVHRYQVEKLSVACAVELGGWLMGQKRALRPKEVWAIRVRLEIKHNARGLAMFNLAIDSKLRACNLVSLRG
jgi:hypothetical protein